MPLTADQEAILKAKVAQIVSDDADAATATAASNAADDALATAQSASDAGRAAEAAANAKATATITDFKVFVEGLTF